MLNVLPVDETEFLISNETAVSNIAFYVNPVTGLIHCQNDFLDRETVKQAMIHMVESAVFDDEVSDKKYSVR